MLNQLRNLRALQGKQIDPAYIHCCNFVTLLINIMLTSGVIQLFCRLSSVVPDSIQNTGSISEFFQLGCLGAQYPQAQRLCSICANAPAYKLFSSIRRIRGNLLYRIRKLKLLRCRLVLCTHRVAINSCCPCAAVGIKGDGYDGRICDFDIRIADFRLCGRLRVLNLPIHVITIRIA